LHFFHATDTKTGQTIWSSDSAEVVSHENGHAILDGLRPSYLGSFTPDAGAFHESFGDVMAIMVGLQDDNVVRKVVEQTGGDLSKSNVVANLGEQIGVAMNDNAGSNVTGGDYTRTALNSFTWQDPSTLPDRGGPTELGSEVHSFSRLWTGAVYDVLRGIVDENRAKGMQPFDALRAGGNELLKLYANLFKTAPQGSFTYRDMAKALVAADQQFDNGQHAALITKVFTDRKILEPGDTTNLTLPVQPAFKPLDKAVRKVEIPLNGSQFGQFDGAVVEEPVDADGSLSKDVQVQDPVRANMAKLIAAGRIKMTTPGQQLKRADYFDANGHPYVGVVTWQQGRMTIEPTRIAE
jgi:hypothetical protein